jgi:hypothetical protein
MLSTLGVDVGGIGSAISARNTLDRDTATPTPDKHGAAGARPASATATGRASWSGGACAGHTATVSRPLPL